MCNTKQRYVEAGVDADQVSNEIQCLIGSTQKRSVDGAIQRATRSDMGVPLHTGRIQDGGGMETNRRTAVRIEPKLICGVKECRYQNTREVAGNTERDKISRGEREKADDGIQTDGHYAYSGAEKEVMKSWGNSDTRLTEGWLSSCCTQYVRSWCAHTRPNTEWLSVPEQ